MVRLAGRASKVIINQEEKNLRTDTSEDGDKVSFATQVTALVGAWEGPFSPRVP